MVEEYTGAIGIVFQRSNPLKYILIKNKETGNITFPGGGKEEGESSSKQSLIRELEEETGLLSQEYQIIETPIIHEFIYNSRKKERSGQVARHPIYLIETKKLNLFPKDPDTKILGWFNEKEVIKKLTFSESKEFFKKAIKFISQN